MTENIGKMKTGKVLNFEKKVSKKDPGILIIDNLNLIQVNIYTQPNISAFFYFLTSKYWTKD